MKKIFSIGLSLALAAGLLALSRVQPAQAASLIVNTSDDELNTDGDCSLREAIRAANSDTAVDACTAGSGADTITLPAGIFNLTLVGAGEDNTATGDLDLASNITITGASTTTTTINGSGDRVFHVLSGNVTISNLTVSNGIVAADVGGGIRVDGGALTLNNVTVSNNTATSGGGIYLNAGTLTVNFSTIGTIVGGGGLPNVATTTTGGGIHLASGATATINNSTIAGNTAVTGGGGLFVSSGATVTLNNSTLSGNSASGAAVTNGGGGLYAAGTANLNSVTVVANSTNGAGGGILQFGGTVNVRNTIIADQTTPAGSPDCSGTLVSLGYNLLENAAGCNGLVNSVNGDRVGSDPALAAALAYNGGPTQTHALNTTSIAIDAGNPAGCTDGSATFSNDQRGPGFLRHQNFRCDIGAFEFVPTAPTVTPTFSFTPSITPSATQTLTPSATNSPAPSTTPSASASVTATRSATATPAPKLPVFIPPRPTADLNLTGTALVNAALTSAAATATAQVTPSATPDVAQTSTSFALTNVTPTFTLTMTPSASATPPFTFPAEDAVFAISQSMGRAGGRFTCGIWLVEAAQDAIPESSVIHCNTVSSDDPNVPALPRGLLTFWQIVEIKVTGSDGEVIPAFTQPLKVCAYYKDDYLTAAGGDAQRFIIYTSSSGNDWESWATLLDAPAQRVCASMDRLSLFRLAAVPPAGGGALSSIGGIIGLVFVGAGLLLLVVILIIVIAALRARKPKDEPKKA